MRTARPLLIFAAGILVASATLTGCAYSHYMEKERVRGDDLRKGMDSAQLEGQVERDRTIALKAERKQLGGQIAANKRTLNSLEAQRAKLVAKPRRTSGEVTDLERIKSDIARLQKQNAEKQQRLDNLNKNI